MIENLLIKLVVVFAVVKDYFYHWSLFLCFIFVTLPSQATSFNCDNANNLVEKMICGNPEISRMDDDLGREYLDTIKQLTNEKKLQFIEEQKHWLQSSRNVCSDQMCLKYAYWSRIAELETFFKPKPFVYEHEGEKAEEIKKVLLTVPLYESTLSSPRFCREIYDDLKSMKGIRFVDPIVKTLSYQDTALNAWKKQCDIIKSPLNFSYACDTRNLSPGDSSSISSDCSAGVGLPPFKLFELPSQVISSSKKEYVFYSDSDYGPMNREWSKPHIGGGYAAGFDKLTFPGCKHQRSLKVVSVGIGDSSNYNSIIEYNKQYYFLYLYKENDSYWLSIENASQKKLNPTCEWSPVKSSVLINEGK